MASHLHFALRSSCKAQDSKQEFEKSRSLLLLPRLALKLSSRNIAIKSPLQLSEACTFPTLIRDSNLPNAFRSHHFMLQDCTSNGFLPHGMSTATCFIRNQVGYLDDALRLFDKMPYREDTVAEEGLNSLCAMQREGVQSNRFALSMSLKTASSRTNLDFGRQMHAQAIKMELLSDFFVGSGLVDLYVKCGETELAEKAFRTLPNYNEASLNALLNGYAQMGDEEKVFRLFQSIPHSTTLDKFTLSIVLKCCARLGDVRKGRELHSLMIRIGLELDEVLASNLIDVYAKCGCYDGAFKVFHLVKFADVVIWTSMISCLNKQQRSDEAIRLFMSMTRKGVQPNQFTLSIIVSAGSKCGNWRFCASVHARIIKDGFELGIEVSNAVLDMYMRGGNVKDGSFLFESMVDRDVMSWNALLSGYHKGDNCIEGLRLFRRMLTERVIANRYSFISVLRSCTTLKEASYGRQVHTLILKSKLEEDSSVGTALVDMYTSCGNLNQASLVFDRMEQRDVFSWTMIISGHAKEDQGEEAVNFYRCMLREGIGPNEFTLASCLKACSDLTSLDLGRQFHATAIKCGPINAFVTSSLVDLYVKCGCLMDSEFAFACSCGRDLVLWNTIICGYSQHGFAQEALNSFKQMLEEGWRPDQVTFLAVLSACSHVGLLEEGKHHFESMNRSYGMTASIEHYACMISLLGRAGKLDEVERFIVNMEITPNALIWQTVLAACVVHGNMELGERAAANLFKLEPRMDSAYVLLGNLYANLGMWAEVGRVRSMMEGCGLKKEPGCSWIHGNGEVNVFLAGDTSHPMFGELYLMLDLLTYDMVNSCAIQEEPIAGGGR